RGGLIWVIRRRGGHAATFIRECGPSPGSRAAAAPPAGRSLIADRRRPGATGASGSGKNWTKTAQSDGNDRWTTMQI
ncbi:MAG TPA: hypothetical protein VKT00_06890, partial [Casimicrobiaceae bacterium]|nr:hypothetical protein [Casimicrobiaceae bacterium]